MLAAVIFIQLGNVAVAKQTTSCLGYIRDRGYHLIGFVRAGGSPADAVKMVDAGVAQVVVVAYGGRDLAAEVIAAGGVVEAVHPTPHVVEPPVPAPPPAAPRTVPRLLAHLLGKGRTVEQIAAFLDESTQEIRRILRRGE